MGGGTITYPMDVSNHTPQVNKRDPFSMTYGAEAVIPLETSFPMLKTSLFCPSRNNELLKKSLDLIEKEEKGQWSNWHTTNTNSSEVIMPK